jgi:hypothetical protein
MNAIRSFASPHGTVLSSQPQRRAARQALALAVALLLAVLIVEAVAIATAAPDVSEIGWLSASTT